VDASTKLTYLGNDLPYGLGFVSFVRSRPSIASLPLPI
jgi:hypothetical protein